MKSQQFDLVKLKNFRHGKSDKYLLKN